MAQRTPLYEEHARLGAKIVDFAGWEMPVQYTGVMEEHLAVRKSAGLFDVSHMGQIEIAGPEAGALVQSLTTNDVTKMTDGRAQYSIFCNERGTVIDDIIVYRFSAERYIIVVNASNAAKDFAWVKEHERPGAKVSDLSGDFALIAFQGPRAAEILASLTDVDLSSIGTYYHRRGTVAGKGDIIIARTGYTGEDGFELFTSPDDAPAIWQALMETGRPHGILAAGLGSRDTLRLEMKYSLYGHEITEETNPLEAGLGWVVKLGTPDEFVGKTAIQKIKDAGLKRRLAGFRMTERGIPRQGYPIVIDGKEAGIVTSGTMSPSLGVAIGIGYVPSGEERIGNKISIDIRGQAREAVVVETPFYKK
ncbi:MAG TPA: glycine cleavage system aminomethyltransferase GcvT [bacterium]|nr:glycine cleavage system aminomethyltransferase GcvT [bacterium]